jgi:hypothetical protein
MEINPSFSTLFRENAHSFWYSVDPDPVLDTDSDLILSKLKIQIRILTRIIRINIVGPPLLRIM